MPFGKPLLFLWVMVALTGRSTCGAPLLDEAFAIPPNTVGSLPSGWTAVGEGSNNDFVAAANLVYPGLAEGTAGSWQHDGSQLQRYYRDFSTSGLAPGQVLYYSFLIKMDSLGKLNTNGYTSGNILLGTANSVQPGNGTVAAISFRKDSADFAKFNIGVSSGFRGMANSSSSIVGLGAWEATGGTAFGEGQTLLLVVEYSYTITSASTVRVWVNPAPDTLGAATAPPPTLATDGKGSYMGIPVQRILVSSIGNTSAASGFTMTLDAFRVGNTWADVTPKGGPVSFARMDRMPGR